MTLVAFPWPSPQMKTPICFFLNDERHPTGYRPTS
jgi:hypothetical protein